MDAWIREEGMQTVCSLMRRLKALLKAKTHSVMGESLNVIKS
jgi:hypothetical protein